MQRRAIPLDRVLLTLEVEDDAELRGSDHVDREAEVLGGGAVVQREAPRPSPGLDPDTYCRTFSGFVYAAFVLDVFSRRIVGWQLSRSLRTELALDALNMGIWTRRREGADLAQLIHHSDRGVQYVAVRYTERLAEQEAIASVGSVGDSYDNAMAEAFNSLFKAELVRNKGPWKGIDDLEVAVAGYIDWYNHRRLHGELGLIPPVEHEIHHHNKINSRRALGA